VVEAAPAVIVVHRHDQRLDRNPVAALDVGYVLADFENFGGKFMTEDLWQRGGRENMRGGRRDDRTGDIFVQIGSADAGPQRLDQQLIGLKAVRLLDGFDADILAAIVADSSHGFPFPYSFDDGTSRRPSRGILSEIDARNSRFWTAGPFSRR